MNYSCCYVLTDDKDLQYFNQMMISLTSLRYVGFTGAVYVVTDSETARLINPRNDELNSISAELVVIEIEGKYTEKEKSRYLKTSLRKYIQGDTLFVDTDTVFISCLPEWISDSDIAITYDLDGVYGNQSYQWHKKLFDQCRLEYQKDDYVFLNSGVIWMRDTDSAHDFFEKWHSFWKELLNRSGIPIDQVSLNYLWKHDEINVSRLDDRYNVQISRKYFSPFTLTKALIFHYFNNDVIDPIFPLNNPFIQKLDYRDGRVQRIIQDPVSAFPNCRWMKKDGITDDYLTTQSFQLGLAIFRKHRRLFLLFEAFSHLLLNIRTIFGKKKI